MFATLTKVDIVGIIAIFIFAVIAVVRIDRKTTFDEVLVPVGLAVFVLMFLINP